MSGEKNKQVTTYVTDSLSVYAIKNYGTYYHAEKRYSCLDHSKLIKLYQTQKLNLTETLISQNYTIGNLTEAINYLNQTVEIQHKIINSKKNCNLIETKPSCEGYGYLSDYFFCPIENTSDYLYENFWQPLSPNARYAIAGALLLTTAVAFFYSASYFYKVGLKQGIQQGISKKSAELGLQKGQEILEKEAYKDAHLAQEVKAKFFKQGFAQGVEQAQKYYKLLSQAKDEISFVIKMGHNKAKKAAGVAIIKTLEEILKYIEDDPTQAKEIFNQREFDQKALDFLDKNIPHALKFLRYDSAEEEVPNLVKLDVYSDPGKIFDLMDFLGVISVGDDL